MRWFKLFFWKIVYLDLLLVAYKRIFKVFFFMFQILFHFISLRRICIQVYSVSARSGFCAHSVRTPSASMYTQYVRKPLQFFSISIIIKIFLKHSFISRESQFRQKSQIGTKEIIMLVTFKCNIPCSTISRP